MAAGTNHGTFLELQSNPLAKTHPLLAALVDHLLEPAWSDVYPSTGVDSPVSSPLNCSYTPKPQKLVAADTPMLALVRTRSKVSYVLDRLPPHAQVKLHMFAYSPSLRRSCVHFFKTATTQGTRASSSTSIS